MNFDIVLIIFELYGNNYENLNAKYYKFNHNLIIGYRYIYSFNQINIISFKSYLGIAFISYDLSPYYIIFGNSE